MISAIAITGKDRRVIVRKSYKKFDLEAYIKKFEEMDEEPILKKERVIDLGGVYLLYLIVNDALILAFVEEELSTLLGY